MFGKYGAFVIQSSMNGADAVGIREINGDLMEIELRRTQHVLYEGWYGKAPAQPGTAISGTCLYGRDWYVEFSQKDKANSGAKRSPALESERNDILDRISKGRRIVRMGLPELPQIYHQKLIAWEGASARSLGIKEVYYHVPTDEYHFFITQIERAAGIDIPKAHECLDQFSEEIRNLVLEAFKGIKVHFLEPFPLANGDPNESFLLPYFHPEFFGIPVKELIGIENMVETRLSYEAARRGGPIIPVFSAVIDIPNPYFEKGDGNNIIVLEL